MIELESAKKCVRAYLDSLNVRGGLEINTVKEYPCGWVFTWDAAEAVRTRDRDRGLAGNIPILVVRYDGAMYSLGPMRFRYDPDRYPEGIGELLRIG